MARRARPRRGSSFTVWHKAVAWWVGLDPMRLVRAQDTVKKPPRVTILISARRLDEPVLHRFFSAPGGPEGAHFWGAGYPGAQVARSCRRAEATREASVQIITMRWRRPVRASHEQLETTMRVPGTLTLLLSTVLASSVLAADDAKYLDPIGLNVPPIASDKSVRYDYDIVYVRAPRYGDGGKTTWTEVSHPHKMDPGADLMLLHPDGSEELLVEGGKGSVTDPMVSFDGQWVYFALFHDLTSKQDRVGGSDIYKIHVKTRKLVRLTNFGFLPNTGAADWSDDFVSQKPGKVYVEHALFNLNPCPLPGGRVIFVSNRRAFRPPSNPGGAAPTLQLFVMDDRGADAPPGDVANLECIGHLNVGSALHPVVLADGRVMFSSMESQGLRTHLEWSLWSIQPDGTYWNPIVSAFAGTGGAVNSFHFQTQLGDRSIVYEEYYVGSNFGMGTLRRLPIAPPPGTPAFGPADRRHNPGLRSGRFANGHGSDVHHAFSPYGIESLTPFAHGSDTDAPPCVRDDNTSPGVGKFTHPAAAPDGHMLVVWTPGPAHTQRNPQADGGIYLIKDSRPIDEPAQMRLIKNDPKYNEQWPRALVPYQRIYGIKEPPRPRIRSRAPQPRCSMPEPDAGVSYEIDPDYLEHASREALDEHDQPDLPWDA
jgi:hypothetical protein